MNLWITFLFSLFSITYGIELSCKFLFYTGKLNYGYNCRIENQLSIQTANTQIDTVSGAHKSVNQNSNVDRLLFVHNPNMHYIPHGYGKYFKNLTNFWIAICPIESIKKSDFEEPGRWKILGIRSTRIDIIDGDVFSDMKSLEELHLHSNQIKTIDENAFANLKELKVLNLSVNKIAYLPAQLFIHNANIENIDFSNNKMRIIESDVFLNLLKVKEIKISGNLCTNKSFPIDFGLFEHFIPEIEMSCENPFKNVIEDMKKSKQDLETEIKKLKLQNNLTNQTLISKQNEMTIMDQTNVDLRRNYSLLSSRMLRISLQNLKLEDEVKVLKMNHSDVAEKFEKLFNKTINVTISYTRSQENLVNCYKKSENLSGKINDMRKKLDWFELNYTIISDETSALLENKRKMEANFTKLSQEKLMVEFDLNNLEVNHTTLVAENEKCQDELHRLFMLSQNYANEEMLRAERNERNIIIALIVSALVVSSVIIYKVRRRRKFYAYRTNEFEINGNILDAMEGHDPDIQH